jgi:hypothetical protein
MLFVRLRDHIVELATAIEFDRAGELLEFKDSSGTVVARFNKLEVLAYSHTRERVAAGIEFASSNGSSPAVKA